MNNISFNFFVVRLCYVIINEFIDLLFFLRMRLILFLYLFLNNFRRKFIYIFKLPFEHPISIKVLNFLFLRDLKKNNVVNFVVFKYRKSSKYSLSCVLLFFLAFYKLTMIIKFLINSN